MIRGLRGLAVLVVIVASLLISVAAPSAYASTGFGIERYSLTATNEDASADTQAGSHPYELTAEAGFDFKAQSSSEVRSLDIELPPGLTIDSSAVPFCTRAQLDGDDCPNSAAVGVVRMGVAGTMVSAAVYNMVPAPGNPAELGFALEGISVIADVAVRTGGDYGMTVSIHNIPQDEVESVKLVLWGVPSDPGHDALRGSCATGGGMCPSVAPPKVFLTSPTACTGSLQTTLQGESWGAEAVSLPVSFPGMTGCERLSFDPSIGVVPDTQQAGEPAGYEMEMHFPQTEAPEGLASADLKEAVVTLPEGTGISVSFTSGLQECSEAESGLGTPEPTACPNASKVGEVEIKSPFVEGALESEFQGGVYLLQSSPPDLKLLVAASANGVNLKFVLNADLNESTGQVTFVMRELPQLPIGDLKLHFSGGALALLVNPPSCGVAASTSELTPWSGNGAVSADSSFEVDQGAGGTPCSSVGSFGPVFQAGATTGEGGGYDSLTFLVTRSVSEQDLSTIAIQAPQSVQEMFAGVPACSEPQAAAGACPEASRIGGVRLTVGSGPYPAYLTGDVYLTGSYRGAQQGLSIAIPFDAGLFQLGTVVIRASVQVNPQTGQMTILSHPLPGVVGGIPVPVRNFELQLDHGEFSLDPDGCEPPAVTGVLTSTQGAAVASVTDPLGTVSTPCSPPQTEPAVSASKGGGVSSSAGSVSLAGTRIATSRGGQAAVRLTCTGTSTCTGKLTLTVRTKAKKRSKGHGRFKTTAIGTATFSIPPGKTATVMLKLDAAGRALLGDDYGRMSATLTVLKSAPVPAQTHSETVQLMREQARSPRLGQVDSAG
jgi:hypothetical protein